MERFKELLIFLMLEPWVLKGVGSLLITLSSFALALGLRNIKFEHHIERLFSRSHALSGGQTTPHTPSSLFEQWPIIQALLPETLIGFFTYALFLAIGYSMVHFGKTIDRMY